MDELRSELLPSESPIYQFDIVGNLPIELGHKIFSFLRGRDLKSCLFVCKYWRDVTNSEFLWKKVCENENIDLYAVSGEISRRETLNVYGAAFVNYERKLELHWLKGTHKMTFLPYEKAHCDGQTLVTTRNDKIWFYSISAGVSKLSSIILPTIMKYNYSIVTDSQRVVIAKHNFVLIYKKSDNSLEEEIVLMEDKFVSVTMGKYNRNMILTCECFLSGIVWLYECVSSTMYLFCTKSHSVVKKINCTEGLKFWSQCEDMVYLLDVNSSASELFLYSPEGEMKKQISVPGIHYISFSTSWASMFSLMSSLPKTVGSVALGLTIIVHVEVTQYSTMRLTVYSPKQAPYIRVCVTSSTRKIRIVKIIQDKFLFCYPGIKENSYTVFELPSCQNLYSKYVSSVSATYPIFIEPHMIVFMCYDRIIIHDYRVR